MNKTIIKSVNFRIFSACALSFIMVALSLTEPTAASRGARFPLTNASVFGEQRTAPQGAPNDISVKDARQSEPTTGTRDMVFTVTLALPAAGTVTVNFTTADEPAGPGKAVAGTCGAGGDYVSTNGQVAFTTGQQVKTINVPICSDAVVEPDETFLVNLSAPTNGIIQDGQATGTITQTNTPGTLLISELRHRGPLGANDDFVEVYNNSDSPLTISATDGSTGYGVFKMGSDCNATPVLVGIIPNTTNIPARGHYLLTGSSYSLASYGGTNAALGNAVLSDIEDDRNVGLFSTTIIGNISSVTRLDAVGFGLNIGSVCDVLREPSTLGAVGALNIEYSYFRKQNGFPIDTNSNSDDFIFADTAMTNVPGVTRQLGAPGPENSGNPRHGGEPSELPALDRTKASAAIPNQDRDFVNIGPNGPNGSFYLRRRFVNNTSSMITRLRFRIVQLTTGPTPAVGTADLRALTASGVTVNNVNDATTCATVGSPTTVPCQVNVQGTTLETPPAQANGGGLNATMTVTIPSGVAAGASVAVQFVFGIVQGGNFTLALLAETIPGSTAGVVFTGNTESGPTSSNSSVTGRIVDGTGNPIEGAVVRLTGAQDRKFITDANGVYRFDGVQTGGFYTVTPSRANYIFSPAVRSFTQLGESTEAAFGATLAGSNLINPLDTPEYFVRQHYLDFLGREPDEAGFNFWSDQILACGNDLGCIDRRRENVSAAYFLSIEFQKIGGLVDGMYRVSYGVRPNFAEFMPDTRAVGLGVVVGRNDWESTLNLNKEAFVAAFVNRAAFQAKYDGMDNTLYVDNLISNTGVNFASSERDAWITGLATGTMTRAEVLRRIAEHERFVSAKLNEVFVMMEYFGYLRRDPDAVGFAFWLNKLNDFDGNFERAEMVKAFIVSGEHRDRFPR